jgi:Uma2 family endonuclease
MAALAKIPVRMTVAEFLEWDPQDGFSYELVDGEPRAMAPASAIHGFLQNELGRLIGNHLRENASGCEVVAYPGIVLRLLSEWPERPIAISAGRLELQSIGFHRDLAELYARTGLAL